MNFQQQTKQIIAPVSLKCALSTQLSRLSSKPEIQNLLDSPADIVYLKQRGIIAIANLGNNTVQLLDSNTLTPKLTFGVPYTHQLDSSSKPPFTSKSIDGLYNQCYFNQPHGMAMTEDENYILIADTESHSIRIIDIDNQICSTICGDHLSKSGIITGKLEFTKIEEPRGICLDRKGNIYLSTKQAIVYLDLENSQSSIIAGDPKQFGFKDGTTALSQSLFDHPDGLLYLPSLESGSAQGGILLVADTYNHRIRVIDLKEGKVSTLCGNGEPGHVDGQCSKAKLNFPQKLEIFEGKEGNVVLVSELNDCIRAIDLQKREIFTLCGGFDNKNGLKDGNGQECLMNFPYGMTQIAPSTFLITESDNHSLRTLILTEEKPKTQQISSAKQSQQVVTSPTITSQKSQQLPNASQQQQQQPQKSNNSVKEQQNVQQQQQQQWQNPDSNKVNKFSQSTYQMLLSVANSSANSISDPLLDLVCSYFTSKDFSTKEVLQLISKCLIIIFNLTNVQTGQETSVLKHKEYIITQVRQSDPQILQPNQLQELRRLIEEVQKHNEAKLPGIRSLFQWIVDFDKAGQYFILRSNLDQRQSVGSLPTQAEIERKPSQKSEKENAFKIPVDNVVEEQTEEESMEAEKVLIVETPQSQASIKSNPKFKVKGPANNVQSPLVGARKKQNALPSGQRTPVNERNEQPAKERVVSPKNAVPSKLKQVDQNKQTTAPSKAQGSPRSHQFSNKQSLAAQTVPKKQYDEVVNENKKLKDENEQLRIKMAKMKEEFMQLSSMMESILSQKNINIPTDGDSYEQY